MKTYEDTLAGAREALADEVDERIVAAAEEAVESKTHRWVADPEVQWVWGLIRSNTQDHADIVLYLRGESGDSEFVDFTVSDEFLNKVYGA